MIEMPSIELLQRWRDAGDNRAVEAFLDRHLQRLLAIVRKRLSAHLGRRIDAEDVVQSACRTFCVRIRDGRLDVDAIDSFEKLLVRITLNKLLRQAEHHQAGKRALSSERSQGHLPVGRSPAVEAADRLPLPADVAGLNEELELLLQHFQPLHRQMIELRLLGHATPEIAVAIGRTERMVRKVLTAFEERANQRLNSITA